MVLTLNGVCIILLKSCHLDKNLRRMSGYKPWYSWYAITSFRFCDKYRYSFANGLSYRDCWKLENKWKKANCREWWWINENNISYLYTIRFIKPRQKKIGICDNTRGLNYVFCINLFCINKMPYEMKATYFCFFVDVGFVVVVCFLFFLPMFCCMSFKRETSFLIKTKNK